MAYNHDHAEHDEALSAKKVTLVSAPTLFAVTSGSVGNSGNVTLNPSPNFIGIVTVANPGSAAIAGNVTLDPGSRTGIVGNLTLTDSKSFIGLTTTVIGSAPTIFAVVNTSAAGQSSVVLDASPNFIGIVTVANKDRTLTGNVTISDSKGYIGLVTATSVQGTSPWASSVVGNVTLTDSKGYIGLVTATSVQGTSPWVSSIVGNITLSDPKGFIGLVTVVGSLSAAAGNVTLDPGSRTGIVGNVTLSDAKTFIGLTTTTLGASPAFVGIVTVTNKDRSITGNLTLTDSKGFIGLTTTTLGDSPAFIGIVTVTNKDRTITGNLTLTDSKAYIGLVTATLGNSPVLASGVGSIGFASVTPVQAWPDPKGYIGLVTITGALSSPAGNVTLDPGSQTGIKGNLTLTDSKGFIGLVTVGGGVLNTVTALTDITNPIALKGNLTLTDAKTYVGLVTATLGASTAAIGKLAANSGVDIGDVDVTSLPALPAGANFIGLVTIVGSLSPAAGNVTLDAGSLTGIRGNITLTDSKAYIGLVSIGGGTLNTITAVTDITNPVAIKGNMTLSDSKTYVGLVTATIGNSPVLGSGVGNIGFATVSNAVAWPDPKTYIGLVTITGALSAAAGNITLDPGSKVQIVGNVTITSGFVELSGGIVDNAHINGNVTLSDAKTFIGLTTSTLGASPAFVGIVTIANSNVRSIAGNLTLTDAKTYIGLVTATSVNGGTNKVLIHKNIAFAQASIVTIAVPSNTFKITHLAINANATVRINIKSGASYLTGNVSLGMNLVPGGGWVENGSPDSPVYIGLAGASAIVVEKLDLTATSAQIGGKLIYFDE